MLGRHSSRDSQVLYSLCIPQKDTNHTPHYLPDRGVERMYLENITPPPIFIGIFKEPRVLVVISFDLNKTFRLFKKTLIIINVTDFLIL